MFSYSALSIAEDVKAKADDGPIKEPIVIQNNVNFPKIIFPRKDGKGKTEISSAEDDPNLKRIDPRWGRPYWGFWFSLTNSGMVQSLIRVTTDTVLVPNSREQGFGIGMSVDVTMPNERRDEGFRFLFGVLQLDIIPAGTLSSSYTSNQLESAATLASFGTMYRWGAFRVTNSGGVFWMGLGGMFNYVVATSRKASGGGSPVSYVKNSYGVHGLLSFGVDLPVAVNQDIGFEVDWHPPLGYSGRALLRTVF